MDFAQPSMDAHPRHQPSMVAAADATSEPKVEIWLEPFDRRVTFFLPLPLPLCSLL